MPSSSSRPRAATRRSPRPAPRPSAPPGAGERPLLAPFAAVFGVLVAAEDIYLGYLLWAPDPGWHWFVVAPLLLAVWAAVGAAMVWLGRAGGWLVLTAAAVLPLIVLVALVTLFGALGGGQAMGWALLLLVGPIGCLALTLRRPVREWTRPGRGTRSADVGHRGVRPR